MADVPPPHHVDYFYTSAVAGSDDGSALSEDVSMPEDQDHKDQGDVSPPEEKTENEITASSSIAQDIPDSSDKEKVEESRLVESKAAKESDNVENPSVESLSEKQNSVPGKEDTSETSTSSQNTSPSTTDTNSGMSGSLTAGSTTTDSTSMGYGTGDTPSEIDSATVSDQNGVGASVPKPLLGRATPQSDQPPIKRSQPSSELHQPHAMPDQHSQNQNQSPPKLSPEEAVDKTAFGDYPTKPGPHPQPNQPPPQEQNPETSQPTLNQHSESDHPRSSQTPTESYPESPMKQQPESNQPSIHPGSHPKSPLKQHLRSNQTSLEPHPESPLGQHLPSNQPSTEQHPESPLGQHPMSNQTSHSEPPLEQHVRSNQTSHSQPPLEQPMRSNQTSHSQPPLEQDMRSNQTSRSEPPLGQHPMSNQTSHSEPPLEQHVRSNQTSHSQPPLEQHVRSNQTSHSEPPLEQHERHPESRLNQHPGPNQTPQESSHPPRKQHSKSSPKQQKQPSLEQSPMEPQPSEQPRPEPHPEPEERLRHRANRNGNSLVDEQAKANQDAAGVSDRERTAAVSERNRSGNRSGVVPPRNRSRNRSGVVPPRNRRGNWSGVVVMFGLLLVCVIVAGVLWLAFGSILNGRQIPELEPSKMNLLSVQDLKNQTAKSKLNILIVGKQGIGKKTLVEELFGKETTKCSEEKFAASAAACRKFSVKGISFQVAIFDSAPNLNRQHVQSLDLVVFALRMDDTRYRGDDQELLQLLSRRSGLDVWSKGIIALTFANRVSYVDRDTGKEHTTREHLLKKKQQWKDEISGTLKSEGVASETLSEIPAIPVGHPSKLQLYADTESWKTSLIKCMIVRLKETAIKTSAAIWRAMEKDVPETEIGCDW